MEQALAHIGPCTLPKLVAALQDEPESRVRYTLGTLKEADRCHIHSWERYEKNYVQWIPVWGFGPGKNALPPEHTHTTMKEVGLNSLDHNPGAALQAVTVIWGHMTMNEVTDDQE